MRDELQRRYLVFPFYKLYYIERVADFPGFTRDEIDRIRDVYAGATLEGILAALRWVAETPDADLTDVLPGLRHTNEDLHRYAKVVLQALS